MSLPGVAELLRPSATPGPDEGDQRRASGREKHAQKITVYLSAEELVDLERARVALLRSGIAADRGRIVREAIAVLLADLDARGKDSLLAKRIASTSESIGSRAEPLQTRDELLQTTDELLQISAEAHAATGEARANRGEEP